MLCRQLSITVLSIKSFGKRLVLKSVMIQIRQSKLHNPKVLNCRPAKMGCKHFCDVSERTRGFGMKITVGLSLV